MHKCFLCVIFLIFLLSGCCRHCYRSQPLSLNQTDLAINVEQACCSDAIACKDLIDEPWWCFFKDPQLSRFIELSLCNHPDIKIADARIRKACHKAKIERAALFPHVFAIADVQRQKVSELGQGFVPGFPEIFTQTTLQLATAVYELDIWQKNRSLYFAALDEMRSKIANYEEAKLLLSTAIAAVYFDLQMALERKTVTQARLKKRQELLSLHKQQFNLGIISEYRLYEVDTDIQLLKDLNYLLDAQIAIDEHALAALVGNVACPCKENGELLVKPAAQFDSPFPLPTMLPIDLLARRPDITAKKWLVEAACYDVKAARAAFFPRIDLMGWIGFQSIDITQLLTGKALIALGEATATLPLFVAGKLKAKLGVAHETLEIAIEKYNQALLIAVQQVSDALSNLTTSAEREKSISRAIQDAKGLVKLTEEKYAHAVYNKLSVLNSYENLYVQEDLKIQIQLARYESAIDLIRAIGGGYYVCSP